MHRFQFCAGEVGSIVGAFVCTRTDAELRKELEGLEEPRICLVSSERHVPHILCPYHLYETGIWYIYLHLVVFNGKFW